MSRTRRSVAGRPAGPQGDTVIRAADLPVHYNAVAILEDNLPARADKVALHSVERRMTFRELSEEVNRVGNALRKLDVRAGECVGVLSHDCAEWVASWFGIMKIGAVALSVNTLLKPEEHGFILDEARARVVIVHEDLLPSLEQVRPGLECLEHVVVIARGDARSGVGSAYREWIRDAGTELEAARTHRDDPCILNFSSGTTGEPKGVFHAHKDLPLTARLWGVDVLGLREEDRTFAAPKLFFVYATGCNLVFPFYVGASIVLMEAPPRVATNVLETISRFEPTIFAHAPTGYASLLAVPDFTERYDLSSLRLCVSAGEALPAPIWQAWKDRTGVDILDGIGSTEVFHIFVSNRPGDIRPGSSGKPVDGYELKIVNEEGSEVGPGKVGNLLVKGETSALFYLRNYERSRRTFLGEWLHTGDKYYRDEDGYYWHAGRSDDMMKVGGIWVSPVEVESALLSHPAVLECAVVGRPDTSGLLKPRAFVVLKEGSAASGALAEEMIAHCRKSMADYKRPRWIEFVDDLPKTATGKIQRFKLR